MKLAILHSKDPDLAVQVEVYWFDVRPLFELLSSGNVNDRYGTYISRETDELPMLLAQKAYDEMVIKKAESRLKWIGKGLKGYSDDEIEIIYRSMHSKRQELVTPVEMTRVQMEAEWYAKEFTGKEFQEGTPVIISEKGERVRSKSEKILADFFFRKGILYKYECPLHLSGYGVVYPDFTFFSKKLGEEIYWEHEGMMDNPDYARTAVKKMNCYQMNGIFQGERLIVTYETEQDVLNSRIIGALVEKYLL